MASMNVAVMQAQAKFGQLRAAQAVAKKAQPDYLKPLAGAAAVAARRLSMPRKPAADAMRSTPARPRRSIRRGSLLRRRGSQFDLAREAVEASKFVAKFREAHTLAMNTRLIRRRSALKMSDIRFASRRPGISSQSGLIAQLNALSQETETLALVRAMMLNGVQRMSVAENLDVGSEQPNTKPRRYSMPIDWDAMRLNVWTATA